MVSLSQFGTKACLSLCSLGLRLLQVGLGNQNGSSVLIQHGQGYRQADHCHQAIFTAERGEVFKATTNGDVGSAIRFFYLNYRFSQLDLRRPTGQLRRHHLLQQLLDGRNRGHRFQSTFHSIKSGSGLPPSGGQRLTGKSQTLLRLLQSQTAIDQFNLN